MATKRKPYKTYPDAFKREAPQMMETSDKLPQRLKPLQTTVTARPRRTQVSFAHHHLSAIDSHSLPALLDGQAAHDSLPLRLTPPYNHPLVSCPWRLDCPRWRVAAANNQQY